MATLTVEQQVQQIYIGLLGRAADKAGLDYWTNEITTNVLSIEQLRANIVNEQPEYAAGLGSLSRAQVVAELYQNLFERAAESVGLQYWISGDGASVNIDQLVLALTNAAGATDRLVLDNKTEAATYYAANAGAGFTRDGAKAAVDNVDATRASVDSSKSATDGGTQSSGDTFTLTTGIDSLTGTANGDTFNASLALQDPTVSASTTQTLTSADEIDGGEGTDRLNVTVNSADADNVLIDNVENIYLRSRDATGAIDMDNVSGAAQLWSDRSTNDLTLTNVQNGVIVGLNDVDASTYDVTYAANVLGSPAFTQTVVANGAGDSAGDLVLDVTAAGTDAITGLTVSATGANFVDLSSAGLANVETLTVTGSGSLTTDEQSSVAPAALETIVAGDYTGDFSLTAAANANLQSVTTGLGDDSITLGGDLADEGFVNTGAGDDTVDAGGNNVDAGASIDLGAGDDVVTFGAGVVDKDATVDGGAGTDILQLQAVASANVGAFSNFEVFDVAALNKTLDLNILSANNDVQEIVGSAATGGAAVLTNLGAGVSFRATADMAATNDIVLTQATAGALDVTLDVDQAATAASTTNNDATTTVDATNATSINVAFDSASVNAIAGAITNTQTIVLDSGAAASINVVSGGENAANVLTLSDTSSNVGGTAALLTELVITGDQALTLTDIVFTLNGVVETIDASDLTGGLTASLANLANGGSLELGSGTDVIAVGANAGAATGDIESIVGFELSASTTDADLIAEADVIDFVNAASVSTGAATGDAQIADGVIEFLGAGPSTLDEAIGFANTLVASNNDAGIFEYVGNSYVFIQDSGTGDSVVELTGVTGVDSLNVNAGADLYIA